MTLTKKILKVMEDGKSRTKAELMEATGATGEQIRHSLQRLATSGCVEVETVVTAYSITPRGEAWVSHVAKTPAKIIERKVARRRIKRLAVGLSADAPNHLLVNKTANSVFSWGAQV